MNQELLRKYKIPGMLKRLGIEEIHSGATTGTKWLKTTGDVTCSISPIDGETIAKIRNELSIIFVAAFMSSPGWRNW